MGAFIWIESAVTLAWILVACARRQPRSRSRSPRSSRFRVKARWIPTLVSYAVGALLGAVFLDLLPHIFEADASTRRAPPPSSCSASSPSSCSRSSCSGATTTTHDERAERPGRGATRTTTRRATTTGASGWMIVVGDSFHNFTDGVIIASAFLADMRLGVVTSLAIIAHEIPQEIGDFLMLLHSGFGKRKALLLNVLSGLATVVGALIALLRASQVHATGSRRSSPSPRRA